MDHSDTDISVRKQVIWRRNERFDKLKNGNLMAIGFYEDNDYASHGAFTLTSTNDGATWTESTTVDDGIHTLATGICQLANGTVLAAVGSGAGTGINEIAVRASSDNGVIWGGAVVVVHGGINWISRLVPLGNGGVMLVYASSTGIYQKTSTDSGATWGRAITITRSATTIVGAGRFRSGEIVTVAPSDIKMNRPVYMVSADHGVTWSSPVLLEDQDAGVHQGSALLEAAPGRMVVAYGKRKVSSGFGDIRIRFLTLRDCDRALSGHGGKPLSIIVGGLALLFASFIVLRRRRIKPFLGLRNKT